MVRKEKIYIFHLFSFFVEKKYACGLINRLYCFMKKQDSSLKYVSTTYSQPLNPDVLVIGLNPSRTRYRICLVNYITRPVEEEVV